MTGAMIEVAIISAALQILSDSASSRTFAASFNPFFDFKYDASLSFPKQAEAKPNILNTDRRVKHA